jgi:hypothetical protein
VLADGTGNGADAGSTVLRVRACTDAVITLETVPGNPTVKAYQVVLGADMNTRSLIRDGEAGPELVVSRGRG